MSLAQARWRNFLLRARTARRDLPKRARKNLRAWENLRPNQSAKTSRYVVFDLETSGLSTDEDRVLSVGAVRMEDGLIRLDHIFNEYVNPGEGGQVKSVEVHGITPQAVKGARSFTEVFNDFLAFAGGDILVAHQAKFDLVFFSRFMHRRYGFPPQNLVIDTLLLARALFPPRPFKYDPAFASAPFSLDSLIQHYDLDLVERHTALGDALAAAMILQRLLVRMAEIGPARIKDVAKLAGSFAV